MRYFLFVLFLLIFSVRGLSQKAAVSLQYQGGFNFIEVISKRNAGSYKVDKQLGNYQVRIGFHYSKDDRWSLHQSIGMMTLRGGIIQSDNGQSSSGDYKMTTMVISAGPSYRVAKWLEPGCNFGLMPTISYQYIDDSFDADLFLLFRPYIQFNMSPDKAAAFSISLGSTYLRSPYPFDSHHSLGGWGIDMNLSFKYAL